MAGRLIAIALSVALAQRPALADTTTSSAAEVLTRCRDVLLTCRRLAKMERAKRDEARHELAACRDQPPVVQQVEVEVMPAWAWGLIAGAAGIAAGAIVAGYVIARE
jgi:hypothetical protein